MKAVQLFTIVLLGVNFVSDVQSSGIPMWEFLSRGEKVSRLFHVFMRQVDDYCNTSDMPDCNKAMMVHGLSSLARMEDDHLDAMDPYQRDAHGIIWDAMMHEHDKQQPSEAAQPAAEAENGSNQLPSGLKESASNVDIVYARPGNDVTSTTPAPSTSDHSEHLGGPMVVRLLPDGRPVPGDPPHGRRMHEDLDMIEYRMMNTMPHHHPSVAAFRTPRQLKFKFPFTVSS